MPRPCCKFGKEKKRKRENEREREEAVKEVVKKEEEAIFFFPCPRWKEQREKKDAPSPSSEENGEASRPCEAKRSARPPWRGTAAETEAAVLQEQWKVLATEAPTSMTTTTLDRCLQKDASLGALYKRRVSHGQRARLATEDCSRSRRGSKRVLGVLRGGESVENGKKNGSAFNGKSYGLF